MKRQSLFWLTALILGVGASSQPALAQTLSGLPPPGGAPMSPYLNMLRPGSIPAINYYGLVQPQLQMQSAIASLQLGQMGLTQAVSAGTPGLGQPLVTGHPAVFVNYGHYFPMRTPVGLGMGAGVSGIGMGMNLGGGMGTGLGSSPMTNPGALGGLGGVGGLGGLGGSGGAGGAASGG
jgi:hypothetical protein